MATRRRIDSEQITVRKLIAALSLELKKEIENRNNDVISVMGQFESLRDSIKHHTERLDTHADVLKQHRNKIERLGEFEKLARNGFTPKCLDLIAQIARHEIAHDKARVRWNVAQDHAVNESLKDENPFIDESSNPYSGVWGANYWTDMAKHCSSPGIGKTMQVNEAQERATNDEYGRMLSKHNRTMQEDLEIVDLLSSVVSSATFDSVCSMVRRTYSPELQVRFLKSVSLRLHGTPEKDAITKSKAYRDWLSDEGIVSWCLGPRK